MKSRRRMWIGMLVYLLMSSVWFGNVFSQTGALKVVWDPNSENDLAGYKVYYGSASQNYTNVIDAGTNNEYTINSLTAGATYYFAVTAYDTAGNESDFSVEVQGTVATSDFTPPQIQTVTFVDLEHVDVEFSEVVEKTSAENAGNYSINGGVEIVSASLNESGKVVSLTTSTHGNGFRYTITINGIKDLATPANTIAENSTGEYVTPQGNSESLEIISILKQDQTKLEVVFSTDLDQAAAENVDNYSIDNNVSVLYASLRENQKAVVLVTSDHLKGVNYTLTVNNLFEAGNPSNKIKENAQYQYMFDNSNTEPLLVESVSIVETKNVEIYFNKPVLRETAENIENYYIGNGVEIVKAELLENLKVVSLSTSTHQKDVTYTLVINNIQDLSTPPNVIAENTEFTYLLNSVDETAPVLISAEIFSATKVELTFSEQLDKQSAESVGNYKIDKGIQVESAELGQDKKTVYLTTNEHVRGTNYTVTVNDVYDLAENGNKIADNSSVPYYFTIVDQASPEVLAVEIKNETQIEISFTEQLLKATAENVANYSIDKGIEIQSANLDASQMIVTLTTTSHQRGEIYTIILNNLEDLAPIPNIIEANTAFSYSLSVVDTEKPVIVLAKLLDTNKLQIQFSEEISKESAENAAHYSISNGVTINSATLQSDAKTVELATTAHSRGQNYLIYVSGINDLAETPNEIVPNSSISYYFEEVDTQGPNVASVKIINETHVEIEFNEQVTPASAENPDNYDIDKGIQVEEVSLDENLQIAYLTTSSHSRGILYTIQINDIEDISENRNKISRNTLKSYFLEIQDTTPPKIDSVRIWAADHVAVYFSERISEESAEYTDNYYIDGIIIKSASLRNSKRVVDLKTNNHDRGLSYRLSVSNIMDLADTPNEIAANSGYQYFFESVDMTPPTITNVELVNEKTVRVVFSEDVETKSAEAVENYQISNEIEVLDASMDEDDNVVLLKTTEHNLEGRYFLTVSNVHDTAPIPNAIRENSTFTYKVSVDAVLKNISLNHYKLDSLSVGSSYYVDRDYRIVELPESKSKILSLKTANSDRWRTDESFLSFSVEKDVTIYVGYDSRATSVPFWLQDNFTETGNSVAVSDLSHEFRLWKRTCSAGTVDLGGNMAEGALGAKAMYIVLVENNSNGGNGDSSNPDYIPVSYKLYQNFPNPFNGGTQIRFDVPEKCNVKVTIFNILGQRVKILNNEILNAGQHEVHWDGRNEYGNVVGNGLYLATLEVKPQATNEESGLSSRPYREVIKLTYLK